MIIELLGSVVLSCIGAAVIEAWGRLRAKVAAYRIERTCSVEGTFISEYQARAGTDLTRAMTQLRQHGREIRGMTVELLTERTWKIKGEVDPRGFLRGTYSSIEEPERSLGNFLLALNGEASRFDGLWSHCDTGNREITGGQYKMRRCTS